MTIEEIHQTVREVEQGGTADREAPTYQAGVLLLALTVRGSEREELHRFTGYPLAFIDRCMGHWRRNGVWKDGKVHDVGWEDARSGDVAFWLDAMTGLGLVDRQVDQQGPKYHLANRLFETERANVQRAIRYLRARFGTPEAFAAALGISVEALWKATGPQRPPSRRFAQALAQVAGVAVDALLSGAWPGNQCPTCGGVGTLTCEPASAIAAAPEVPTAGDDEDTTPLQLPGSSRNTLLF